MHFSDLGTIALLLALAFAIFTGVVAVTGAGANKPLMVSSARRGVLVVTFFLLLASAALMLSFLSHDFGVSYVAQHSNLAMPWYFTTAAFYAGQEGSLLYWSLMLSVFSAIFILSARRAPALLVPYIIATLMAIQVFLLLVLTTVSSPFVRLASPLKDGVGLNPLLMDPGMLIHPPTLLMGYMSFALPFAFAVAAMITGKLDSDWLRSIRSWTLASWTIQSAGLLLGAWWAYHVLGWGGYWGWDPVENAALLPWLTSTAFLHSTMVQERRGMLKVWNLFLVVASFALSIFGTFEVRSGLIGSVHSFAYSDIGTFFLTFLVIVIIFSSGLFIYRLPKLRPEQEFDSVVSREGTFLLNNLLLVGIAFATLWGTLFPLISQAIERQTVSVGPPFYQAVDGPLFVALLLAMGVGPLLAWRRTSTHALQRNLVIPACAAAACAAILPLAGVRGIWPNIGFAVCSFTACAILYELWRGMRVRHSHGESYPRALFMLINRYRQRYGGYIVHLGLVLLAVGVIGSQFFQQQQEAVLNPGQSMQVAGNRLLYFGNFEEIGPGTTTVKAILQIWHNGQYEGYVYPGSVSYASFASQPVSLIPIPTYDLIDVYVFLVDAPSSSQATIRVFINPLVELIWLGGLCMLGGGLICWWPARRRQGVVDNVSAAGVLPVAATQPAAGGSARAAAQKRIASESGGVVRSSRSSPLLARIMRRS